MADRIEKSIELRAPVARVWRALTDHQEFSTWFHVRLDGPFVEGRTTAGNVTYPGYEHLRFEAQVQKIEAPRYFAYRWHPYPKDPEVDYSAEPTTLVEFTLEPIETGTRLRVVESGFDRIPAHRRVEAFRMNTEGWEGQLENIAEYLGDVR